MVSIPERCPDTGACHHECPEGGACFRVLTCGPLSIAQYPGDEWPEDLVAEHRALQIPSMGANAEWDLFVHGDPEVQHPGREIRFSSDLCRYVDCRKPWTEHEAYFEEAPPEAREGDFGGGIKGLYCPTGVDSSVQ